jgi:signal transduction histidine kinase/FixJ family two-component response regulator
MGNRFSLYRWFRDVSIARKLYFTIGAMALLIGVELIVLLFSLNTLSSLRAYVGGEGLWSKAQKDAVFHLYRYGVSRTEKDYQLFQQFMQVPVGDARARTELLLDNRNMDVAREGFLAGRNHPDDIAGMMSLFINFNNVSYISKAINIWGTAQGIAMQLLPIAEKLHEEINSPHPSQAEIDALLASVYTINEKLTAFEDEFSFTLGEGSRWLERVVFRLLLTTALTVETTGLFLAISVSRGIQKGLTEIIRAASSFSAGNFGVRAKVLSRDEIGVVANAFNEMAGNLQQRMGELARLNEHLRHEIGERERSEADSRKAFRRLEDTLQELRCQVAERLRTEEMLRSSEKMKALGQLTGGIAHDFNNLLGVIIGSAEILTDMVKDQPEHAELARQIVNSALGGSLLTRRLLAVARSQPLRPERVDLGALLQDHVELLRRTLGEAIHIEARHAPDLWFTSADPSRIGDALLNLALNARDAMPLGGGLMIEAANVHLDARDTGADADVAEGDYVVLSVTDTGSGMPEDVVRRAVEPFFTTKPPSAGSGLGLSMAYGFAKQSGGHLDIESVVGVGTTVRLYLPRASETAVAVEQAPQATNPDPGGNETILLVDDNQTLVAVARRHLLALGYRVVAASSGPAALAILEAGEPVDLLFTDIVMPEGMSGYMLAEAARRLRPDLKMLFTTGYAAELPEHGEQPMLHKPYDRRELARAVRTVLDGPVASARNSALDSESTLLWTQSMAERDALPALSKPI